MGRLPNQSREDLLDPRGVVGLHEPMSESVPRRVSRRSVVVTGGASGIGRAIAERQLVAGDAVVVIDNDAEALETFGREANRGDCLGLVLGDVSVIADLERAADVAQALAPLLGWVNNAAINGKAALHEIDHDTYRRIMSTTLDGVFWGSATAVKRMLVAGQGGSIVSVSSIHASRGFPGLPVYAAAKGAIEALTRQMATEYADRDIRCNAVAPGVIVTPRIDARIDATSDPAANRAAIAGRSPIGRVGRPDDVAAAAHFLLSAEAGFVTGHVMVVDGGAMSAMPPVDLATGATSGFRLRTRLARIRQGN